MDTRCFVYIKYISIQKGHRRPKVIHQARQSNPSDFFITLMAKTNSLKADGKTVKKNVFLRTNRLATEKTQCNYKTITAEDACNVMPYSLRPSLALKIIKIFLAHINLASYGNLYW